LPEAILSQKIFETRLARTPFLQGGITSQKQAHDQAFARHAEAWVSTMSIGPLKRGGPVAILRQGGVMWITNLQ
jgi:hypothetical protein